MAVKRQSKSKSKAAPKSKVKAKANVKLKSGIKTKSNSKSSVIKTVEQKKIIIKNVSFIVEGLKCGGNLYLPAGIKKPPVVIMAHGFGAEMTFGLPLYAEKFAKNGVAVLTFDYRFFGISEGEPRHMVSTESQLRDWEASIDFVRGINEVDGNRICIWGCSLSGGHVIVTAARNSYVKAFISHVPFMDSIAFMNKSGFGQIMKVNAAAMKDIFNSMLGRPQYNIAIVGRSDEFAILNTPECYDGYMSMVPENSNWINGFPARSVLKFSWYRPIKYIPELKCKGQVVFAEYDSLSDADMIEKAFADKPDIQSLKFNCGHFNLFEGEYFKKASEEEIRFLKSVFS